jgi:hypothetical protein
LLRDQERRHEDRDSEHAEGREIRRQRPVVQEPRTGERHGDLHDFRGLEAHDAEIEPALGAHRDVALDRDREQQQHAQHVQERGGDAQHARRNLRDRDHDAEREPDARGLPQEYTEVLAGRTEQHHEPGRTDGEHRRSATGCRDAAHRVRVP